ncbi:MAG: hypothetical protein ACREM1_16895 [Longimicrobiales bacterium]
MRFVHGIAHVPQYLDDLGLVGDPKMDAADSQSVSPPMNRKAILRSSREELCSWSSTGEVTDIHEPDESKLDDIILQHRIVQ